MPYRFVLLSLSCLLAACHVDVGARQGPTPDLASGVPDLATAPDDAGRLCGAAACAVGERCYALRCIPDNGTCISDDECQNDTYCSCSTAGADGGACTDGVCLAWSDEGRGLFDPDCGRSFSSADFKDPVVKCHWLDPDGNSDVVTVPLVVDLDGDGKPEIIFQNSYGNTVIAMHGDTCKEVWRATVTLTGREHFAAADLDDDGSPEIVVPGTEQFTVLGHDGTILAQLPALEQGYSAAVAIANVDGRGPPELGIDGSVYRYAGGQLELLWSQPFTGGTYGTISLFADMDGDGLPELVTGLEVYDGVTGADETPAKLKALGEPGAYPAVADFNGDGHADLVLVQSDYDNQHVSVFDYTNDRFLFGPFAVKAGGHGGSPTVGDFDGDGVPDIGVASDDSYYVYALKCAGMGKPADCTGKDPGVLWQRTVHDLSSGGCGSSTFDFNGDGANEVVYRDECFFRVMSGRDGQTLFAQPISSLTVMEYPVIADVDRDGHADIVVPSDNHAGDAFCMGVKEGQLPQVWKKSTTGVFVLSDPQNRWMPSRPLWHQHSYHISEINDDLTVPLREPASWLGFNTYRKNVQGLLGGVGADFTATDAQRVDNGGADCSVSERLWSSICNRGPLLVPAGLPGTFYTSDPRQPGATVLCTARTADALQPGRCEPVFCDRKSPPTDPEDLWFRANDDGASAGLSAECKGSNDLHFLPGYLCKGIN